MGVNNQEVATLAGGCFWCLEAVFEQVQGVAKVVSGYSGGHMNPPSYQQVCAETTGHAEVVQITFDSQKISYPEILEILFEIHDPTTLNYQGHDVGSRYRSAIFYHNHGQKLIAEKEVSDLGESGIWANPIVTEVTQFAVFYPAEDYHQQYYRNNQYQPYCQIVISPKLAKFQAHHISKLKPGVESPVSS